MPLEPEEIASALNLDEKSTVVTRVMGHIETLIGEMELTPSKEARMNELVLAELNEWGTTVLTDQPKNEEGWLKGVAQCVKDAGKRLREEHAVSFEVETDMSTASELEEARHHEEAERMDKGAMELRLPTVLDRAEGTSAVVGYADMGKVVAAKLEKGQALRTADLATCTGVCLFDPETNVGAMMHVYDGSGIPTIEDALEAMKAVDPELEPGRLQVVLMPGISTETGNRSHLAKLQGDLAKAGITHVRDHSKIGQKAGELLLKDDGVVIASMNREKLEMKVGGPKMESVGSGGSVGMGTPGTADAGEKPLSVREALAKGKTSPTLGPMGQSVGQGAGDPSTAIKVRR